MQELTATYSPEDNKLRLYAISKLDEETYQRIKKLGFKWAPRQELFVAPMWTPLRKKVLVELCGDIEDEQMSLEERAAQRAERFETYQKKRKNDAESAYKESSSLSECFTMGQPILVGHHSEKKARKTKEKIERAMDKAVTMWDRSEYWESRAQGVLSNVAYKESTGVRLRRIKKLEAERRKHQRYIDQCEKILKLWNDPNKELTLDRAKAIANHDHLHIRLSGEEYTTSLWSALADEKITPQKALAIINEKHPRTIAFYQEWVDHNTFRINYENEILKAQGYVAPEPKKRPKLPPIVNYAGEGFVHITKEEWSKKHNDYKCCRKVAATESHEAHRVRKAMHVGKDHWALSTVFITDQKIIEPLKK